MLLFKPNILLFKAGDSDILNTINMNDNFLNSIAETVGPMDSEYGYSSAKLTNYFNEKYPFDYFVFGGLQPQDLTDDLILSKVTQLLMTFESMKQGVKVMYKGCFTPDELSFLFQLYNGIVMDSDLFGALGSQNEFLSDFDDFGKFDFSDNPKDQDIFRHKIQSMGSFEFYVLRFMIDEYWNQLPSPVNHSNLLNDLMDDSEEYDR